MRRLKRQRFLAALSDAFELDDSGEELCLSSDDLPSFSLLDWLGKYLGETKEFGSVSVVFPQAFDLSVSVTEATSMEVSLRDPIAVHWGLVKVWCYGFTELSDRYKPHLKWLGRVPIPITILKP